MLQYSSYNCITQALYIYRWRAESCLQQDHVPPYYSWRAPAGIPDWNARHKAYDIITHHLSVVQFE